MKHKILVAEDEVFIANLYKKELEEHGVTVTIAANGKEVIDLVSRETFDLIILDLLMPVMDGYEVLKHLQHMNIRVPVVIVVTNTEEIHSKQQCIEFGVVEYLVKSETGISNLWTKVKKHLRRT